jgi:hypothetical protein
MLVLNGFLGFLQVAILPGMVFVLLLNVQRFSNALMLTFPASLFLNYILFMLVAKSGLPMQPAWLSIVACELIILSIFLSVNRHTTFRSLLAPDKRVFDEWLKTVLDGGKPRLICAAFLTALCLALLLVFLQPLASVFTSTYAMWDDTLNWGRWSANWATNGSAGKSVMWYPQLGPINRAIPSVLMGNTEIHFFSRAVMPLFSLWTCFMFLVLELRFKNLVFLSAAVILQILILRNAFVFHDSGLMDLPAMMLIFASVYSLLMLQRKSSRAECRSALIFSAIAGAAAIWTKQSGLVVFLGTPIALWWVSRRVPNLRFSSSLVILMVGFTAAALSFYLPQYFVIRAGTDEDNVGYLRTLNVRDPWFGTTVLGTLLGYPFLSAFVIVSAVLCFCFGQFRALCLPSAILFFLIWGGGLNYVLRNFLFGFPMVALMAADGGIGCVRSYAHQIARASAVLSGVFLAAGRAAYGWPLCVIVPALLTAIAGFAALVPDRVPVNRQRNANLQMHPGLPVNVILDAVQLVAPDKEILTVFAPATTVPEAEGRLVFYDRDWSNTFEGILSILGEDQYGFLVYEPGMVDSRLVELVDEGVESGKIKVLISNWNTYLLQYDPVFFQQAARNF